MSYPYIQTGRGALVIEDPESYTFSLTEISNALANTARFSGHTTRFYSVAEHTVRLVEWMRSIGADEDELRAALLHDAAEAFIGDVVTPIKSRPEMGWFRDLEARILGSILEQFDTPIPSERVKAFDFALTIAEGRALLPREAQAMWLHENEPMAGDHSAPIGFLDDGTCWDCAFIAEAEALGLGDVGRWAGFALCSKGYLGKVEGRKELDWGPSFVGVKPDGSPWASRDPQWITSPSLLEFLGENWPEAEEDAA